MRRGSMTALAAVAVCSIVIGNVSVAEAAKKKKTAAPAFRSERTYFHCVDDLKLQNVPAAAGDYPTWDTTAPTGSALAGAGCGHYENAAPAPINVIYEGTFVGNLRAMTFELYTIDFGSARATNILPLDFTVSIDGEEVFASGAHDMDVEYVNSDITAKMVFSLSGLASGAEPGAGTTERTITVQVNSHDEMQTIWVWDTTEVPAGITFNPATLEATTFTP